MLRPGADRRVEERRGLRCEAAEVDQPAEAGGVEHELADVGRGK